MPTATFIICRTVGQITLSGPSGSLDLAPFFTIARDRQGLNADRAATANPNEAQMRKNPRNA